MKRLSILFLLCMCGCLAIGSSSEPRQVTKYLPKQSDGCIFIANGSGDSGTLSENLAKAMYDNPNMMEIETFQWSHGKGQSIVDHMDRENHEYQAKRLADQILRYHAARPQARVYIMGHSTGCAVVLAAAERLPPESIEKIALLAPSVSDQYDLRPALMTSRKGIDSYSSTEDNLILGLGIMILGTTDPNNRTAAGLSGFRLIYSGPNDAALYQKLKQHQWSSSMEQYGNDGSHNGVIAKSFLKSYVVPELLK